MCWFKCVSEHNQPLCFFFFSSTTLYCVRIILSLTTQGVPDTTTFTEGDGCMRVCVCLGVFVFRRVSAHTHEYAPSSYVYWFSGDIPLLLFLFVCLFVCFRHIYYCYFYSPQTSTGKHATSISCHADNITCIECEYTFGRELVNVNANTNQQAKTKEHNMDLFSQPAPLHLLCLPSLLAGVAIRSYNDRISFLPQEPSEAFCFWLEKYIFVGFFKRDTSLFITFIHTLIFLTFQTQLFPRLIMIQTAVKMEICVSLGGEKKPKRKPTWVSLSHPVLDLCCLL